MFTAFHLNPRTLSISSFEKAIRDMALQQKRAIKYIYLILKHQYPLSITSAEYQKPQCSQLANYQEHSTTLHSNSHSFYFGTHFQDTTVTTVTTDTIQ